MKKLEIDAETFDALFDSGEVDMEPYMVPDSGYRPYLEDPRPLPSKPWVSWHSRPSSTPTAARTLAGSGPIKDFAEDIATDRRAPEIQRQLAKALRNRVGVRATDLDLARKVLCQPRYAARTRKLATLVMEHAKTTFSPDV